MPYRQKTSTRGDLSQFNESGNIKNYIKEISHVKNNHAISISNIKQAINNINSHLVTVKQDNNILQLSNSNIAIDRVVASLDEFKMAIYRVNYLHNLLIKHKAEIDLENTNDPNSVLGPVATILTPLLDKKYIGDKTISQVITNIPLTTDEQKTAKHVFYYGSLFPYQVLHSNILDNDIPDNVPGFINTGTNIRNYDFITNPALLKKWIQTYPTVNVYNQIYLFNPGKYLKLHNNLFRRDPLNENRWVRMSVTIDLKKYLPNTDNTALFSKEYMNLINTIQDTIATLNGNFDLSSNEDIWEFGNPTTFNSLKCINSKLYPALWNGQYISQCFIPGSNENMPQIMLNIINDIFYNYPELYDGQIAITTYQIESIHYTSIVKIMIIGGKTYFIQKQLSINSFFKPSLQVTGDTVIAGSLNVKTYTGDSLIETDNVNKISCFHDKVGINQDPFEVNALLDIDNLSMKKIVDIVDNLALILLNSYEIVSEINKMSSIDKYGLSLIFDNNVNGALKDYRNDCVVFKSPIQNVIVPSDITFLYNLSDVNGGFSSKQFTTESFNKIKQIVNEVNRMSLERGNNPNFIFSFVELLNDTKFNYLTSLRAIIKGDVMYFVMTFNDVEDLMNDKSYRVNFTNIINKFSALNRVLNFGSLVVSNPAIQSQLFKGNSVNSFSKYINDSEFRDRFGLNGTYFSMYKAPQTAAEYNINTFDYMDLFSELHPYWNICNSRNIYVDNKDIPLSVVEDVIITYYNTQYNINKIGQNMVVKYDWIYGKKISFVNIIDVSGVHYFLGTGINLNEYIDQSIISKGDSTFSGDLLVSDKNNNPIFKVDTVNKSIANLYKVAIGKDTPDSTLDIKDSSITYILKLVESVGTSLNYINETVQYFKTGFNFDRVINASVIRDDITGVFSDYSQTPGNYFSILEIDESTLKGKDVKYIYQWLYPQWVGKKFGEIDDPDNINLIKTAIQLWSTILDNNRIFDNTALLIQYDWTFGVKRTRYCFFRNEYNHKLYVLCNGRNIQQFNLRINTNNNMQNFFNVVTAYNLYLQDIYIRKTNVDKNNIRNYVKGADVINTQRYYYPIDASFQSVVEYIIDDFDINSDIFNDSKVNLLDFDTLDLADTIKYPTIHIKNIGKVPDLWGANEKAQYNEKTKRMSFMRTLAKFYKVKDSDHKLNLENGYYGLIHFDDLYKDYISFFICYRDDASLLHVISLEFNVGDTIKPTVDVEGDARVKGDLIIYDASNQSQYASIDPDIKFMGINTDERMINYNVNYNYNDATTISSSSYLNQHHVYIKNDRYPNLVCERINENSKNITDQNYNFIDFQTSSAVTMKRKSDLYSFTDMSNNAGKLQDIISRDASYNTGQLKTKVMYGADISFEISDKSNLTKEIGNIQMGIESIDATGNIKAGFGVKVVDVDSSSNSNIERNIMYVSNNGTLYINKIKFGDSILSCDSNGNLKLA